MRFPKIALLVAFLSPVLLTPAYARGGGGGHGGGGGGGRFAGGGFRGGGAVGGGFVRGYGGGYYDRTLAEWPGGKPPATIGVAYDSAKCDSLPRGEHDLPLGAIVTESAVY